MNPIAMTLLILGNALFFAWTANRRWAQLRLGHAEPSFHIKGFADVAARVREVAVYALGQKKMPYYRTPGVAHMMIFAGFGVLLLNTLVLWARGYDAQFDMFGLLRTPVGHLYMAVKDVFAVLVVVGASVFVYYRVVRKEKRMTLSGEGLLILGIIIVMMLADMLYWGASLVRESGITGEAVRFHALEPAASVWALAIDALHPSDGTVRVLEHVGFWTHSTLVLVFGNILPYSKHFHIITSLPNVFTRSLEPVGKLPKIEDLEGKVEREEPIGIAKITDLSWKGILDLYTCTECGRCSDNCPAFTTDKKLSPKHLTLALRDHLYLGETALVHGADVAVPADDARHDIHSVSDEARKGAYFQMPAAGPIFPNIMHPDVIWGCTTCRACEEQCPVMITYVDKIVGMRRDQVMMKNEFPAALAKPFRGLETNGNPWNLSSSERADWAEGLDVATLADRPDAPVLYWVGCSASYDDRAKKIARATARLLKRAGVDFAILGPEEQCTGDPARRAGNEYLFQILAQANIETLNGYHADKKKIITACPHCFNTLANEYKDFGGVYEVLHHTDFLLGLVAEKKLVPVNRVEGKVAYHDSCYLGRYNGIYDSPRKVLESIPGVELVEVEYWTKNKGLCCGAGGAQMFMEEQNDNRVNKKRLKQLVDTGAKTVASGCPFCMTMLTDGLKAFDMEDQVQQLDIAELLDQSIVYPRAPSIRP